MKNYMTMFNKAMDVVHGLGIETGHIVNVSLNYRAKNRFGQCRRNNVSNFTKNYHDYRCGKCGGKFKFDAGKSNYQLLTASPKYSYVENR